MTAREGIGRVLPLLALVALLGAWGCGTGADEVAVGEEEEVQEETGEGIIRVSLASDGTEGDWFSTTAPSLLAVSADGRYVVFYSAAGNLVPGDTNNKWDVFVRDVQSGVTNRVSVASDGTEGDGLSSNASISDGGRYVAFESHATNLVEGDTNGFSDVFVHDTQTGQTIRVSVASDGTEGNSDSGFPSISADGRYVAFESRASNLVEGDANGVGDIFVHDTQTGITNMVSGGNGQSFGASISADGRYVAFISVATDLVSGDTNTKRDVFVRDRQSGETIRVSVASDGTEANGDSFSAAISADGRYVAFWSEATNLVSDDTNGFSDIFVHDTQTGQTIRVSVASDGTEADSYSVTPFISADGRYVAFTSGATNLVPDDTNGVDDVFVHDTQTGITNRVSVASDGTEADDHSFNASISTDGKYVVFSSSAANLVPDDTNDYDDVFRAPNQ